MWNGGPALRADACPDPSTEPGKTGPTSSLLTLVVGTLRAVLFIFASVCAWYSGYLLAELIPDAPLSSAIYSIRSIGERPILKAPPPRGKNATTGPPAPRTPTLTGCSAAGARTATPKSALRTSYVTGKAIAARYFDMYEGDNSGPMTQFIQGAPAKSLLFMVTHDDGSTQLQEDAKETIEALGSKEIRNMRFRSSWVFLTAKDFELPAGLQREKINHSDDAKDSDSGWPAEVQIEGCVPKEPS
ncbi:hypothetical protein QTO34_014890 [Cnephaeus nilssonii]|uniref:ILEI/PANDER domain-containing protein n=1 Tax=Cnephaeus nilssonii TaxID=3371016 RepID=A0AA40LUI5_CNENI|nr:hypothetical protein QTO34_014890 [Eptesicus nilssonii]